MHKDGVPDYLKVILSGSNPEEPVQQSQPSIMSRNAPKPIPEDVDTGDRLEDFRRALKFNEVRNREKLRLIGEYPSETHQRLQREEAGKGKPGERSVSRSFKRCNASASSMRYA